MSSGACTRSLKWNAIGSSYVCRIRDNSHFEVTESSALTPEDHEAGIVSDQMVQLGNRTSTNSARMDHPVRVIFIQTYCAIIACLLISLWTGRKPTLRTYEMICYYFSGLASEDELLAHLNSLPDNPTVTP